jgi:hypothetical protein
MVSAILFSHCLWKCIFRYCKSVLDPGSNCAMHQQLLWVNCWPKFFFTFVCIIWYYKLSTIFWFLHQRHMKQLILQDSSVGIATGKTEGLELSPGSVKNFLHVIQTGSGDHPTSYPMGTTDHSPPASADVKKICIYTSTPPYAFMV